MMIFSKLQTLMRAGVRESVEKVTDANAIRIYRQEIVEAEELLVQRRDALAGMIAARRDLERDIEASGRRIAQREQQLAGLPADQRSEDLLRLAAGEIATLEDHLESCRQRFRQLCSRIAQEEISLRELLQEIQEHRRELQALQSQLARNRGQLQPGSSHTVAGRLATLRDTRNSLCGGLAAFDDLEAGMREAQDRVCGDPVERMLAERGQDRRSQRETAIMARLRGIPSGGAGDNATDQAKD